MLLKLQNHIKKDSRPVLLLLLLPCLVVGINYLIFGNSYFERPGFILWTCLFSGIVALISSFLQLNLGIKLQMRYSSDIQISKRIFLCLFSRLTITVFAITILFWVYDRINPSNYIVNFTHYKWALIAGVLFNIMTLTLAEAILLHQRWKKAINEVEELRRKQLQAQMDRLKSQVNPHFLFNSLNTLSSLINDDTSKAEKFLLKLSKVYRYLVVSTEEDLATLAAEIRFIESYFHLLKTRYGNCVTLTMKIDKKYLAYKLPPLTLQLLIENAVKHNIVETERPLNILLETSENGKLIVNNNLQRKTRGTNSNKVGLDNIAKKYRLLNQDGIQVKMDKETFSVIVPLINFTPSPQVEKNERFSA